MKRRLKITSFLACAAILLSRSAALAFYDPGTQRWINRDPLVSNPTLTPVAAGPGVIANLSTGENLYEFVWNNPLTFVDALGLDCSDPCGDAKRAGLDRGDGGGVICCGGKKYACDWSGGSTGPTGRQIISACITKHEQHHFDDVECDKSCKPKRPPFKKGQDRVGGECGAIVAEIDCLRASQAQCGNDPACLQQLQARVEQLKGYCRSLK